MFDYKLETKTHFAGKAGMERYHAWLLEMGISREDFPFNVKTGQRTRGGREISLGVVSWGYYQAADWHYYVFISYRTSDGRYTCAYHWMIDENGNRSDTPVKHEWTY